jgi:hypothetical protein
VADFYLTEDTVLVLLASGDVWWAGMKIAYKPEMFPLPTGVKARLIGGAYRCFAAVDEGNTLYMKNSFIKS